MTIAERIAQVRKEQNLSQEAFGDALGVSRQAISKWESGVSLPEVEKLIALCRTYRVRIEWLLCMDDARAEPPSDAESAGELTGRQLQMVEEIVSRYLGAIPKPRRRSRLLLAAGCLAAALAVLAAFAGLNGKIDTLRADNTDLRQSVGSIQGDVAGQMASLTERMEEILKSQNDVAADYGYEVLGLDLTAGTATLSVYAVPRQYRAGMTARFTADADGRTVSADAAAAAGQSFRAELTCPLSDELRLSVFFDDGQSLQTQSVGVEYGLLRSTQLNCGGDFGLSLWGQQLSADGTVSLENVPIFLNLNPPDSPLAASVRPAAAEAAVFVNDAQVAAVTLPEPAFEPLPPDSGGPAEIFPDAVFGPVTLRLSPGDTVTFVLFVTDNYGRKTSHPGIRYSVDADGTLQITDWTSPGAPLPDRFGLD